MCRSRVIMDGKNISSGSDVQAIFAAVNKNLDELDARLNFSDRLKGRKVIIKPNLVTVFHQLGMRMRIIRNLLVTGYWMQ